MDSIKNLLLPLHPLLQLLRPLAAMVLQIVLVAGNYISFLFAAAPPIPLTNIHLVVQVLQQVSTAHTALHPQLPSLQQFRKPIPLIRMSYPYRAQQHTHTLHIPSRIPHPMRIPRSPYALHAHTCIVGIFTLSFSLPENPRRRQQILAIAFLL